MKENLLKIFRQYLTGALDRRKVALAIGLGILWGVFPMLGTTTGLCTVSGLFLRLNLALINAVNYLLYPIQLLLIIPFMKLGGFFTKKPNLNLPSGVADLKAFITGSKLTDVSFEVFNTLLNAVIGWLLVAPFAAVLAGVSVLFIMKMRNGKQCQVAGLAAENI